jgi:hypothetical protein
LSGLLVANFFVENQVHIVYCPVEANEVHAGRLSIVLRRTTPESALDEAYERQGITEEIGTHDRESPTVWDIPDILEEMSEEPEPFVVRSDAEGEKLDDDSVWLLDQLRPSVEGGQFGNLGRESEFDIRDEKLIYLDLVQQGGNLGGHTSLLMELLISLVYERAKETDKRVVLVVDEARYLMSDAATLSYLETIFRHHRHHDLSIRLITQTVDEFFQWPEAEMILDQCAIKQFHKLDGMDEEWANEFGLNYAQMRYVQDAIPGNEQEGYSQALLGVDGEWRGMEIQALPKEKQVIDFDPTADTTDVSEVVETDRESSPSGESMEGLPVPDGGE